MKVEIVKVNQKVSVTLGSSTTEQVSESVMLRATTDCNLLGHILTDATYSQNHSANNQLRHTFVFGSQQLTAGDEVVLFTGKCQSPRHPERIAGTDNYRHFLYWQLDETLWNKPGDEAVLFEVGSMQFFPAVSAQPLLDGVR